MSGVKLEKAVKQYGDVQVIHDIDLDIADGEFCVFVGPSGCGKSTLLRMIAGLEETTGGRIRIGGRDVTRVDPADRGVAMVFQTYALYPHMTVGREHGLRAAHDRPPARRRSARRWPRRAGSSSLTTTSTASPRRCRADSASASPSGGPSCAGRRSSSSTSPCRTSMRSCASRCGWRSRGSTRRSARR